MTFKSAYLKLTLFYVLIVMLISISFSVVLYRISSNELNFALSRQSRIFQNLPRFNPGLSSNPDFESVRLDQLEQSNNSLRDDLIYYNLIILLISGALSYWLAQRTLHPIKEMMESQNRFTGDASHELRTPLTAMKTEIEVGLRDKQLDLPAARALLTSNLEEISKLEHLSTNLLRLARYEENHQLVFTEVSLEDIVTEAYSRIAKLADAKDIKFSNDLRDTKIKGDSSSLIELFVILLENAIKYSPDKSTIAIAIHSSKTSAHVDIKDQGIGIKSSDLPYIFNRFYRADPSRSKIKTDGYGLGLSIAQKIVHLHKGSIKVDSHPGKGSTFSVTLPIHKL